MTSGLEGVAALSSDDEQLPQPSSEPEEADDESQFTFRRNKLCSYHMVKFFLSVIIINLIMFYFTQKLSSFLKF